MICFTDHTQSPFCFRTPKEPHHGQKPAKTVPAKKQVKPAKAVKKPAKKTTPARKSSRVIAPSVAKKAPKLQDKKSVSRIAGKKPVVVPKKTTKPVAKPVKPVKNAKKTGPSRTAVRNTTTPVKKKAKIVKKPAPVVNKKASQQVPKSNLKKTPRVLPMYDESEVLDMIKTLFPEIKKRVIENVKLTDKQIKTLLSKKPKFAARIPAELKRGLGIVDDSTKALDAAELAAKTRVVDTEKAKDNADLMQAFEAAKQEQGEAQTSKVIKAVQLRVNKRLFGIYQNYKRLTVQLNNFTSVALSKVAQQYAGSPLSKQIEDQVTKVSSIFTITEENAYDYFSYGGSKLDDLKTGFDEEGDFVDEDAPDGIASKVMIEPDPKQATAKSVINDTPEYEDNDSMFSEESENDSEPDSAGDTGRKITRKKRTTFAPQDRHVFVMLTKHT